MKGSFRRNKAYALMKRTYSQPISSKPRVLRGPVLFEMEEAVKHYKKILMKERRGRADRSEHDCVGTTVPLDTAVRRSTAPTLRIGRAMIPSQLS